MLHLHRQQRAALRSVRSLHSSARRRRELFDLNNVERASDEVDVCIVGGGPAGLSAAIRLKQLEQEKGREVRVVVLEKGAEVGESPSYAIYTDRSTCGRRGLQNSLSRCLTCTIWPVIMIVMLMFTLYRLSHTLRSGH